MSHKQGNLQQIKSLLNKQINSNHHIQFSAESIKGGSGTNKNYKLSATGIGNFQDAHDIVIATPKQKFIQINEEPQFAEFEIQTFGSKNNKSDTKANSYSNSSLINSYAKKPYYHHIKAKSINPPRHVSIMMTNEDASCCSRGTTAVGGQAAPSTEKGTPYKKTGGNGVSAMSQISLFSQEISNFGEHIVNLNNTTNARNDSAHASLSRKNLSITYKQQQNNNDEIDDKTTSIQSPISHHHRVLSASVSQPSVNTAYFSNNVRSNTNLIKDHGVRPHSQNAQTYSKSFTVQHQNRPMTAAIQKPDKQTSQSSETIRKGIFLQKMITGINKKKTLNSASTACNSTIFELFDDKKILLAKQQKFKALDQFMRGKSSTRIKSGILNLSNSRQIEGQSEIGNHSEINSNNMINITSSSNLLDIAKSNKKILQEIIDEMEIDQKEFIKQIITPESKNIVYTQLFQSMEKLIETKDIKLLTLQLIFISKCSLAIQDFDKAAYFLQQVKTLTDMSKTMAPMKALAYLVMGEVALGISKYSEAVKIFKKSLQYSWFFNQRECEIQAYEKLGMSYFYLQDTKLCNFYHTRYAEAQFELPNSYLRNMSYENVNEYLSKFEYNLLSITPILMVHLNLPVQYSLDKVQQGLRESSLKQEQKQNKRNSKISEKLENLAKESQQQVENFVASRQKIFTQSSAAKILELLMEDKEFFYETDTPTQFEKIVETQGSSQLVSDSTLLNKTKGNNTQLNESELEDEFVPSEQIQKKKVWEAPILRKVIYDTSQFGPMKDPIPSQRVFEDITKYKLSLDKKIEILQKQKIDLNKIMQRVNYLVGNNKKFNAPMNQRVRISHQTPNRFDPLKYNTPYYMIGTLNKAYNRFLFQLKAAESSLKV